MLSRMPSIPYILFTIVIVSLKQFPLIFALAPIPLNQTKIIIMLKSTTDKNKHILYKCVHDTYICIVNTPMNIAVKNRTHS